MEKPMDTKGSFGETLKTLRERKRLSRPQLAPLIGVSESSIEKWERGDVLPGRARVEELIRALKLSDEEKRLLLEVHAGIRILPSLHNLPTDLNPYFVGREAIFEQLHDQLASRRPVALTQAITGLGGIGKTQFALHYAYRFRNSYSHVLWVIAESQEKLSAELVKLAYDLDLPEKNEPDQSKIMRAMRRWLSEYPNWLLILDNVEDLGLVTSFVPAKPVGSVLLTTRRQVTEPVAQALVLDEFSDDEGILFLLKRAKRLALDGSLDEALAEEVVVARAITQHLGGLPLALDQAGAYIAETRCGLGNYLGLLKQAQHILLQRRGTNPTDHPEAVTKTFSLAFEDVRQKNEPAIELLKLCAYLAPDAIPLELITQGGDHLGPLLRSMATDPLEFDQALEVLQQYSLIQRDGENGTISIHRLVQAVQRDGLDRQECQECSEQAVQVMNVAFPDVEPATWSQCERLVSHALVCARLIEEYQINHLEAAHLLDQTGYYLYERARYIEAEPLKQRVLAIYKLKLGAEHPDTAESMDKLATIYQVQGKSDLAEPLYQQALTICERQLEPDHSLTARCLHNLAWSYDIRDEYEQAEALYQRALIIHEQQLGPEHPNTARNLHYLAGILRRQDKYSEAEPLYRRALAIRGRLFDPEHPEIAESLNSLAGLYTDQERYSEAEPLCQRALAICKRLLGPEHPDTALSWWWLATLARKQGKLAEAKSFYEQALQVFEKRLGLTHPRTQNLRRQYEDMIRNRDKTEC